MKASGSDELKNMQAVFHVHVINSRGDFLSHDGQYQFIIMNFCEGGSLLNTINQQKSLGRNLDPVSGIGRIIVHILLGLKALHDRGLVHGDLKHENIFVYIDKN